MSFTKNFNKGRGVLAAAARLNVAAENIEEEKPVVTQQAIDTAVDTGNTVDESATVATDITGETTQPAESGQATDVAVTAADETAEAQVVETPAVETPATEPAAAAPVEAPAEEAPAADQAQDAPVEAAVQADDTSEQIEETIETVEEVHEEAQELGETVEKTDDLITDQETLVSLADELDTQADNGGAEPETIRAVEIAVEGIITRMQGGRRPSRVTPSLESFGGVRSKVVSTRLAAESIREWAAEAGKAIAAFFAKIIEGIKALFSKLTGSTGEMKKQILLLKNQVEEAEVSNAPVVITPPVASRLKLAGKVSKEALFAGIARIRKFLQAILKMFKANKTVAEGVNLDLLASNPDEVKIKTGDLAGEIKRLGKVSEKSGDGSATVTYMEELPGDTTVDLTGPDVIEVEGKYYRAAASIDVSIESPATENEDGSVELRALSKEETKKILSDLENLVGDLEDLETPVKETEGMVSKFMDWIKGAGTSAKEGSRAGWEAAKGFAQRMAAGAARALSTVARYVASYIQAVLSFIKSSFGGKKEVKALADEPRKLTA